MDGADTQQPETTARSQARRRRIMMEGTAAGAAGKPVLPLTAQPPGGKNGPGRPDAPSAPLPQSSVTQLQLQAESLARKLAQVRRSCSLPTPVLPAASIHPLSGLPLRLLRRQEQALVAGLQAEQREVLAVNERLRRALQDVSASGGGGGPGDDSASGAGAASSAGRQDAQHILARSMWLRLRQAERTCGGVRQFAAAVHASLVAARAQLSGSGGEESLAAAQRLLDRYSQAGSGHDGGSSDVPLYRCLVLPHTDAHGALGAGAFDDGSGITNIK